MSENCEVVFIISNKYEIMFFNPFQHLEGTSAKTDKEVACKDVLIKKPVGFLFPGTLFFSSIASQKPYTNNMSSLSFGDCITWENFTKPNNTMYFLTML